MAVPFTAQAAGREREIREPELPAMLENAGLAFRFAGFAPRHVATR
jgi:hypothetical protein